MGSAREQFLVLFLKVTALNGFELVFSPFKLNTPLLLPTHGVVAMDNCYGNHYNPPKR